MKDWYLEYFEISKLLTILKDVFRTSAACNSVLIDSHLSRRYQTMMVLLSSKKVCYQG